MEILKQKWVEHKDEIMKDDTKECSLSPAGPNENSSRASKHCCVSTKTARAQNMAHRGHRGKSGLIQNQGTFWRFAGNSSPSSRGK